MEIEKPKRPRGRPVGTTKGERKVNVNMVIRPDQRDKLEALGGSKWFREQIDKARQ